MIGAEFGQKQKTNQAVKTLTSVGKCLRCLERQHIHVLGAKMVQLNTFLDTIHRPKREYKSAMVDQPARIGVSTERNKVLKH